MIGYKYEKSLKDLYEKFGSNFSGREFEPKCIADYRAGHLEAANNALPGIVLFAVNEELVFQGDLKLLLKLAQSAGVSPRDIDFSPFNLNSVDSEGKDSH